MIEQIKEYLEDFVDRIKGMFSKGDKKASTGSTAYPTSSSSSSSGGSSFSFSLEGISDYLENNSKIVFILIILTFLGMGYLTFEGYTTFKYDYINNSIEKVNHKTLILAKDKKEKDKIAYKNIQEKVIEKKIFNIGDLVCFFDKFDRNKISYINRQYKIQNIKFDEEKQEFDIILQGIKHYTSLTDILVLLKRYKTQIDIESYNIQLTSEKFGLGVIDYYTVGLKGKIL